MRIARVFAGMIIRLCSFIVGVTLFTTCACLGTNAVAAKYAAIVVEMDSGEVLFARKADAPRYPASLAKMMTLYLTFEALANGQLSLNTDLSVSRHASRASPSKLGLKDGDRIKVRDAIMTLITKSANDVAIALAETLAGSEKAFAKRMTQKARHLGMNKTNFRNASGLPNRRQKSTARDLSLLARALIRDFPQHYGRFSATSYSFNGRSYRSHNRLLRSYDGTDGIKTGYIHASGFNIAASVQRYGKRLIVVVLGGKTARSRDAHTRVLLDRAFARLLAPRPNNKPILQRLAAGTDSSSHTIETNYRPATKNPIDWGIQVGAFSTIERAYAHIGFIARTTNQILTGSRVAIIGSPRTLYRARIVGLSEDQAHSACRTLKAREIDCHAVAPLTAVDQGDQ